MKVIVKHEFPRGSDICTVCESGYMERPTHCPGRPLTKSERYGVSSGRVDFMYGEWIRVKESPV